MNIGVIGTGTMGRAIGENLAKVGHKVVFGSRTPEKLANFARSIKGKASVGSYQEALDASNVMVLTTPWAATREVLEALRPFRNKILLDCTNPEHSEKYELVIGHSTSGGGGDCPLGRRGQSGQDPKSRLCRGTRGALSR